MLHGHKPRKGSLPGIDLLLRVEEKHSKHERRNKSNTFIATWLKRSECDKGPPVVKRSAVECPPPRSEHGPGERRGIRHGSGRGETRKHNQLENKDLCASFFVAII